MTAASPLVPIAKRLSRATASLAFGPPIAHVYNPLTYAWAPHCEYLERFGRGRGKILIVGMNPGYFGMAQTGIPFGDVVMVRDWLGIRADVRRPPIEHPKRPILGFDCARREVSGERLWGWARDRFGTPERFFARFFVHNYCPLCFLEASGANRAIDKLTSAERGSLYAPCDEALAATAKALDTPLAIGIGRFAEQRLGRVLGPAIRYGCAPHPSPANPQANRDWPQAMDRALATLGVVALNRLA